MPVYPEQLESKLRGGLSPLYLVSGNEPLLVQEACDEIISAARAAGFGEWQRLDVERGFAWESLRELAGAQSLFAERRLLDLRLASAKLLDRTASTALRDYLARPMADVLLLLRVEQLESSQRQSAWYKAIDKQAVAVQIWPMDLAQMPRWLNARCRKAGLQLAPDAMAYLQSRVEGNLLAAVQEIAKLCLLELPQPLSLAQVQAAVADANHYDAFDVLDAALARQGAKVHSMLQVLRAEAAQPLALLGALQFQLRQLQQDAPRNLPPAKARLLEQARHRLRPADFADLQALAAVLDQQVKGLRHGDPWQTLELMLLRLAGQPGLPPLLSQADLLIRNPA